MPKSAAAVHHRWNEIPTQAMNPSVLRQYITADEVTVARFQLAKGGVVPRHTHESEQVTVLLSGALEFVMDDRRVVVHAGEVFQIPSNDPHEVRVLEDAIAIDVFSPVRQDWLAGTDDYFSK
jgi:quercetin dioxygenase-like cupin family protein